MTYKIDFESRFRHFLMTHVNMCESQIKKKIFYWFFLLKSSPFWLTTAKLHHWGHTTMLGLLHMHFVWLYETCSYIWSQHVQKKPFDILMPSLTFKTRTSNIHCTYLISICFLKTYFGIWNCNLMHWVFNCSIWIK